MKFVLCLFEQLSGLKINFRKSELFCFKRAKNEQELTNNCSGANWGLYPSRIWVYLSTIASFLTKNGSA